MDVLVNYNKNWGWFLAFGILLLILGIVAICCAVLTTLVSIIFLGFLLLLGGIIVFIDTFKYWHKSAGYFILHLLIAILYIIAAIMLIRHPLVGAISITFFLAIFYIVLGIFRAIGAISLRLPYWGWSFFSGIVALILGILILIHWPASSLFILGLFVGIDLIFAGWSYIMLSFASRKTTVLSA